MEVIFEKIGVWDPLLDIEAVARNKREEWKTNEVLSERKKEAYKGLIRSTIENRIPEAVKKGPSWKEVKYFLVSSIMDGTYFDAVELFKRIMNRELGE